MRGGTSKPAREARRLADWPTFSTTGAPGRSKRMGASRAASAEVQKYAPLSFISWRRPRATGASAITACSATQAVP